MDTPAASPVHRASAGWGITAAALVAVFVFLPATFASTPPLCRRGRTG
ncbi:hypothetical protein ACTD5D_21900 [Nocardia takedensis]